VIEADAIQAIREPGAIALVVRPYFGDYDRLVKDERNVEIADNVLLLRPESRPPLVRTTPMSPPPTSALLSAALIAFGALFAAGSGWSFALFRQPWELRLALAPAMGMAVLVLVGSALGLAGVHTGHRPGLLIWIGVTAAGWVAALWVPSEDEPEEADAEEEPAR
jgi:hypothetical protein